MPARSPSLRTLFAAAWLVAQAALVLTAERRSNHAFGFRMFEEITTVELRVSRLVDDGGNLPMGATWTAHDCDGRPVEYRWHDLVRVGPTFLNGPLLEPYGADTGLMRARAAVAWVATHTPRDCETRGLVATVSRVRNRRPLSDVTFTVSR
jgi:hypothetical protein